MRHKGLTVELATTILDRSIATGGEELKYYSHQPHIKLKLLDGSDGNTASLFTLADPPK